MFSDPPLAHSFAAACEKLCICQNTGRKLVRDGKLKIFKIGKRVLVSDNALRATVAALEKEAAVQS